MRRIFALLALALATSCQTKRTDVRQELLRVETDFAKAIMSNDADAIAKFLGDDWEVIDPDGNIIDKVRFIGVIRSGTLTHELMESEGMNVRSYGDSVIVTALTKTKGKFAGQEVTTQERATDVFVKRNGCRQCVFSQLTKFNKK
jgi:ketosteroid isomerase-like protein